MKIQLPDHMTIGECYRPAMEIKTVEEAQDYFEALVERNMRIRPEHTREDAEKIERENIGYYAGYYDYETSQRVLTLFGAVHPIFGTSSPDAKAAFELGQELAENS